MTNIKAIYEHFTRCTCGTFWNSVGQFLHFKNEETEAEEEGSFAQGHTVSRGRAGAGSTALSTAPHALSFPVELSFTLALPSPAQNQVS